MNTLHRTRNRIASPLTSRWLCRLALMAFFGLGLSRPAQAQAFVTVHQFSARPSQPPYSNTDGANPYGSLLQASDGSFYGTAVSGGFAGTGTIYRVAPSGAFTTLYSFSALDSAANNYDGIAPVAGLIQASDGNFYGIAAAGGANGKGTIFQLTPTGGFTTLHSFSALNNGVNADGAFPYARLLQASDGNLYGTTLSGGIEGAGTIYQITPSGAFTTLYSFSALNNGTNADGAYPYAGLIQANDGNLYGTTARGGIGGTGTIFQIEFGAIFFTTYSFSATSSAITNYDGDNPVGGLIQASDGNLYGTASLGGYNGSGTVFSLGLTYPGDFNGDNIPDLLFQNASTGQLAVWFMNGGAAPSGGSYLTPTQDPAWHAVGDADFDGNGAPDILFQNTSTGQLALWLMNGTQATNDFLFTSPPAGWNVVAVHDLGHGICFVFFQNASSGQIAVWVVEDSIPLGGFYISPIPPAGWTVVGTGDFNGDGLPDLLFQNSSTGQLSVWFMNGATVIGTANITPTQDPAWKCVAVLDLNKDGKPDLVFQNTSTGQIAYWLMNGVTATTGGFLPSQGAGWQVVGPH